MTDHKPLPIHGYTGQSDKKIALVNQFKQDEERLLRILDQLRDTDAPSSASWGGPLPEKQCDQRWLSIARTHFQEAFMALNRSVFQPQRISLPEDEQVPFIDKDIEDAANRRDLP